MIITSIIKRYGNFPHLEEREKAKNFYVGMDNKGSNKRRGKGGKDTMLGKLLLWSAVFLLVLVVSTLRWEIAWAMVLITATVALAIGELYGRYKADKEYKRDPEVALLIGRYSEGIDHKGRRTGKIIR